MQTKKPAKLKQVMFTIYVFSSPFANKTICFIVMIFAVEIMLHKIESQRARKVLRGSRKFAKRVGRSVDQTVMFP
jgi:hypothetical protein